jgi:hypothetical protein
LGETCNQDSDCGSNLVCDPSTHFCLGTNGYLCTYNYDCESGSCDSESSKKCTDGQLGSPCEINSDCSSDMCSNNICITGSTPAMSIKGAFQVNGGTGLIIK